MAKYLDHHMKMPELPAGALEKMQADVRARRADENGVIPLNVFMGTTGETWCLTEAPNADAVIRGHRAMGVELAAKDVVEVNSLV